MELLTMILVDDEPIILKGLLETYDWNRMGFQVVGAAKNGEAALGMIEEKQPDVVLTDVRMKKMDGLTLIEKSKAAGWKTSFVVISAYRDFEYAQKACQNGALSYLVKPIEEEELERTMAEVYEFCTEKKYKEKNYSIWERLLLEDKNNYLDQMISRYLDGGVSEGEISDLFTSLSRQQVLNHYFAVAAVGIDIAGRVVNQKEFDMKQFLLETQICKRLRGKYPVWSKKSPEGASCYLVDLGESPAIEGMKGILMGLRLEMKNDLISALSNPERGIDGMRNAYYQALKLFEIAGEAGASLLTVREPLKLAQKTQYSMDVETQILSSIRKNDPVQLKKAYEKFVYILPSDETVAKTFLHRLAVRVEFAFEESASLSLEMRSSFRNFYHMLGYVAFLKLIDILYQLFGSLIEQRIQSDSLASEEYFKDYISSAVSYIAEHLQDESLSITGVSERVFLNPVYFGRMFKKMMNVSFKRYVQSARIEKAKELLLEEQESIASVCEKVGIPNQSYFSQLFKQSTGVLPSEYRRSMER